MDEISLLTLNLAKKYTDEHGGGGGTTNYNLLENKPQIAGTTLQGNKTLSDLGIASAQSVSNITNGESINNFAGVETALSGKQPTLTFDDTPTDNSDNPVKSNGIYDALATKQNATDNSLETDAKTIVGAINEHEGDISSLKSGLTNLDNEVNGDATVYPYADVITIEDAVPANLADCSVKIEPVQDLHGYDHPWVGGAWKNKLPLVLADIKDINTEGTWSGNVYTVNDVAFTILTDDAGNITGIKANGTASANSLLVLKSSLSYTSDVILSDGNTYDRSSLFIEAPYGGSYAYSGYTIPENSAISAVRLVVLSGVSVTNIIAYPMIRLSTETDTTFTPYTNVCPISGHTEVDVQRDGKNQLVNAFEQGAILGSVGSSYSDCKVSMSTRIRTVDLIKLDKTKTYTFSIKNGFNYVVQFFDDDQKLYIGQGSNTWTETALTITNVPYVAIAIKKSTDGDIVPSEYVDAECQLEYGTQPTTYEPYAGKTYTIQLGDTIYGGTVDFDSGVMTVDRSYQDMSAKTYYVVSGTTDTFATNTALNGIKAPASNDDIANIICTDYKTVAKNDQTDFSISVATSGRAVVRDSRYDGYTAADFQSAMSGVYSCYELETPTTIQLTPTQIQLLKGTNTLTASTGQISVTVNGVSGSIGSVQEQVNGLAESVVDRFDDIVGYSERVNRLNYKELTWTNGVRDGSGEHTSSEGSHYSNMIEVLPNTTYTISGTISTATVWRIYYSTSNGTWISRSSTLPRPYTFTTPSNCGNIQIQCANVESLSGAQLQYGDVARPFETYKDQLGLLLDRVPTAPTTDGTYNLQVTVSSGTPTYSWVSTT